MLRRGRCPALHVGVNASTGSEADAPVRADVPKEAEFSQEARICQVHQGSVWSFNRFTVW